MSANHPGMRGPDNNVRPPVDRELRAIAGFAAAPADWRPEAWDAAHLAFVDALGCALAALDYPACVRYLGPVVPGTVVPNGARVPGTALSLDPVQAAFAFGTMIRWLDFNDTWLAAEWGHPSDNLGGILTAADWHARREAAAGRTPATMRAVLDALIRAYGIHGGLALDNAFNRVGLDHVVLVKVATAATVAALLGLPQSAIASALSHAFVDGQPLRTYRQAPNTGRRKSWAAGDATARGVRLALLAADGEEPCPGALSAPRFGFHDAVLRGERVRLPDEFGSHVIENVLYKVRYAAEFHAQSAVEAAVELHPRVRDRLGAIAAIELRTQQSALRIIDKRGPLHGVADRDHCLQYMVAVALLHGRLAPADYEDAAAADPRIDALRERMVCVEEPAYTRDYLDPAKRSVANAVAVRFDDGSPPASVAVEYPLGHPRRRAEARPLLLAKFEAHLARRFGGERRRRIAATVLDRERLLATSVPDFVDLLVQPEA